MADLVLNFNLAYRPHHSSDELVTERKKIAINYLKGWFWIDLISSVPFDLISEALADPTSATANGGDGKGFEAASLFKTLRIPKLLRLLKVMRILKIVRLAEMRPELMWWLQYSRNANLINLFRLIIYFTTTVHLFACLFYMVLGSTEIYQSHMDNSWMALKECEFSPHGLVLDKTYKSDELEICQVRRASHLEVRDKTQN